MRISLMCVAIAGLASSALADGNVLVWSSGNRETTGDIAAYLQASECFDSVTWTDTLDTLPLGTLTGYDRILYFTNGSNGQDPNAIGDVLADYADTGRRLVLGVFSWANQGGNTLGGRIVSDEISPFVVQGTSLYTTSTMGSTDGSGYWTGVNALSSFFRDSVGLTAGSTLHGSWADGVPLLASKGNVAAVNFFPDFTWNGVDGDHQQLIINTLCQVPTPGAAGLAGIALLAAGRRRR
ncbi:MAG: hypothetical protein IT435_12045 [Phycisphaerales bacterium]|nr:hypothetical protein [Phycisphaerales bacterium]